MYRDRMVFIQQPFKYRVLMTVIGFLNTFHEGGLFSDF